MNLPAIIFAVFAAVLGVLLANSRALLPDYMLAGPYGDFTGFPKTVFYYGSDEVLYAEAEYYEAAFKKYGARCEMHVGQGMCHCYPMFPYFPEAKQAYREIVQRLND